MFKEQTLNDKYLNLRGHFICETESVETGEIVDRFEKHNMIMVPARTVMSKLFANITDSAHADKFILGTAGVKDGELLIPKDASDGFVKERTSLFSEISISAESGDIINLNANSYVSYTGSDPLFSGIYFYSGSNIISLQVSDLVVSESDDWELVDDLPGTYDIAFTLPGTQSSDTGDVAQSDSDSVAVLLSGTTVTFTFEIDADSGNGTEGTMIYNEAGIYAGTDLFCMKTFPSKVKDETVIMRIIWSIIF